MKKNETYKSTSMNDGLAKVNSILNMKITLLRMDGTFEAKDNRFGTVYHCTPDEDATMKVLRFIMYRTNGINFIVTDQDPNNPMNITVSPMLSEMLSIALSDQYFLPPIKRPIADAAELWRESMKRYILSIMINGRNGKTVEKKSRFAAEKELNKILLSNNLQVEDIILRDNGHWQEFVCSGRTRFVIRRVVR